jgi:hypothetical protein
LTFARAGYIDPFTIWVDTITMNGKFPYLNKAVKVGEPREAFPGREEAFSKIQEVRKDTYISKLEYHLKCFE